MLHLSEATAAIYYNSTQNLDSKIEKEALEFMVSGPRGFNQGFVWTDRSVNSRKRMAQKKSNILGFGG